jgi:DNA polymerase epsilon subunit 1
MEDQRRDSIFAKELLDHFYRWLTNSTGSKLYDPMLHRLVHNLMVKNFFWLTSLFKQTGCKVIYGSFQRLIVETKKRDFEEA